MIEIRAIAKKIVDLSYHKIIPYFSSKSDDLSKLLNIL
jgi:hypothetical protein